MTPANLAPDGERILPGVLACSCTAKKGLLHVHTSLPQAALLFYQINLKWCHRPLA